MARMYRQPAGMSARVTVTMTALTSRSDSFFLGQKLASSCSHDIVIHAERLKYYMKLSMRITRWHGSARVF